MKGKVKRILSGMLSAMTILTSIVQPVTTYASETEPGSAAYEAEYPTLEEIRDKLTEDEIVKVQDYEVEAGSGFDVKSDFSGIEINKEKVKVTFHEAKNKTGQDFDRNRADSYRAVYFVEPVSGNPRYHVIRHVIVKEPVKEAGAKRTASAGEQGNSGESESEDLDEPEPYSEVFMEASEESKGLQELLTEEVTGELETEVFTEAAENLVPATEPETDSKIENEIESETETETEFETEKEGKYEVNITSGAEFGVTLNHEDGSYDAGETVAFSTNLPEGCLTAVGALKTESNAKGDTADILYSEVTYHADTNMFSFEMPAEDIALNVTADYEEGGIMLLAAAEDTPWDEATEIEANTYYYYSDGQLHPFNSIMGSGGNDSYKYVRYKANGKTYTVNAYCMQHSMPSPPSGTTYKNMVELDEGGDDKYLRKALFYGYGGPGWGKTFNGYNIKTIMEKAGCTSEIRAMQHYLVDYLYDGESGFGGSLSTTAKNMLKEIKTALNEMPDPTAMNLLPGLSVTANGRDTETFTWKANEAFQLTIHLEEGVKLVNETTGKSGTGNVTVKGGDKFHLTATAENISKLKGKYEVTSNYPLDFHAMLLKLQSSQDIGFGYYTDSSGISLQVDWPEQAKLNIVKQDGSSGKKLAGAIYGVYSDKDCQNLIVQMPATDTNGASSVTFNVVGSTVYLKELTSPKGYKLNANAVGVKVSAGNTSTQTVTDTEILGNLKIYKEGEVLTGAVSNADGTTFQYGKHRLAGAAYMITAAEDIVSADGTVVLKKGAVVGEHVVTGADGTATVEKLHLGKYIVTETGAPENYVNKGESREVTISSDGTEEVVLGEAIFENDRQKAKVTVTKQDKDTENPLDGGVFGLYAGSDITSFDGTVIVKKGTLIETVTTGGDGTAVFTADLPIGFGYEVKEEQAPEGYVRNTKDVYSFTFSYTNDSEAEVSFAHTFTNERVNAKISLQKKDKETNTNQPQGDATLKKAVYGLYARIDIMHPDGATGVIYKAGNQVATLTTDENGAASVGNLYLGEYFVKEITPPVGYLADEEEYDLICDYEGDLVATVERSCVSPEQVIKQPFQIIKAADNGKTDADLLSGAGFTAYLVSSLKTKEDGSYDFASTVPVVIGENGATEIFTDEKGYACSIALPYGTYLVRETTTPHNYTPVDDFTVTIKEHHPDTPQVWRVLLDEEFEAKLKIIKQDNETKKAVLAKNTEFKVFNLDTGEYVEQVTTYPTTVTHKSYFTDEQGYLILPQNLKIGHYRIEEVNAPFGYTLNENYYEVAVDSNTAYQIDSVSKDVLIEVAYENYPVKGELKVVKQGEVLDGFDKNFTYKEENLAGAVFEVYAAEDIYTADFQKDDDGNRILEYAKDDLVATLTTDENGEAMLSDLPLGSYKVVETKAPEGFVLNVEPQIVTFSYADQNTPVIQQEAAFTNDCQKVEVSVVKRDAETNAGVEGAVFGLYAKEDILAHGEVIVKADALLGKALSGEDGKAVFALDVPFGDYYIKELTAPAGFVSSDEVVEVSASYQGQDVKVVSLASEFFNEPTAISVKKTDITTGVELSGAALAVLDKNGNVVDTWKSVKGEEHIIKRLTVGETYTLREELAPYGYLQAEEITFTVEDTAEVQKVEMKDDVPTGLLIINKKGEFLENVSVLDSIGGWIAHLFEYVSGSLKDVTFEVYALEDIKAADGESEDYYKKDEMVAEITTDDTGVAKLSGLPLGRYYVKEKETADGFVLDGEIREIDLTYRDQNTAEVTYSSDWQNNRQRAEISVLKKEKDSDRVLEGAVFDLTAKEDITGKDGKVIMEAGTVIEEKATDKGGKLTFAADLPIGFTYSIKETAPAPGFATTDEVQEFTFTYEDAEKETVSYEFIFEDEPTVFEFTKTSLTDGTEVEGAHLTVTDEDGKTVDEWVSGKEPHIIRELVVGKSYTMTETLPADGYVTAENIKFTVEDTAEVQKIEMKDDVTKVEISKTDISGKELPGAKLTILDKDGKMVESWTSTDEPHYMEMLPIGEYVLREESAPEGYLVAEDVKFEVKDTGEIQKVVMKDEAKPEETPETPQESTPTADTPKTGDSTHMGLWLLLCGLALAGVGTSVILLRKRKK